MDYRSVMGGQRRDLRTFLLRGLLRLAAYPYGLVIGIRQVWYDSGWAKIAQVEVPVISIGNLTTGGTGKTPLVCCVAKQLQKAGVRVAIVSRGYRRGPAALNDEAIELEQRLPRVPHIQNRDRIAAAKAVIQQRGAQIIVVDDGFQHRRLHRDLEIVVIDATCPYGFGYLLPRGMLREPLHGIRRADIAVLSRSDEVSRDSRAQIRSQYLRWHPTLVWVEASHRPSRLIHFTATGQAKERPLADLNGKQVAAFCGIGNPDAFGTTVRRCGANLQSFFALPDHATYDQPTLERLADWIDQIEKPDLLICTHKDLVKIRTSQFSGIPLVAIQIDLEVNETDSSRLHEPIAQLVQQAIANQSTEGG